MTEYRFGKALHVRRPPDFARIYEQKCKAGDRFLLVFAAPNQLAWTRVGLSVSKRVGNAVQRARCKRLLREAFRLCQHELPHGLDLVLIPRPQVAAELPDLQASLIKCVRQLARKLASETKS